MNCNIENKILKGWSYITNQELDKAEELCKDLKLLYDEQEEKGKINIKKYMVRVNIAKREWEEAKNNLNDIINISLNIAEIHKLNAMVKYHLNNYEEAEKEFKRALKLAKNNKEDKELNEITFEILVCLHDYTLKNNSIDTDIKRRILQTVNKIYKENRKSINILQYIGKINFNLKEYKKTEKIFIKVLLLAKRNKEEEKKIEEINKQIVYYLTEYISVEKKVFNNRNIREFLKSLCYDQRYYDELLNLSIVLGQNNYFIESLYVLFKLKKLKSNQEETSIEILKNLINLKKYKLFEKYIAEYLNYSNRVLNKNVFHKKILDYVMYIINVYKKTHNYKDLFSIIKSCIKDKSFVNAINKEYMNIYNEIGDYIYNLDLNSKYIQIEQIFKDIYNDINDIPYENKKIKNILLNEHEKIEHKLVLKSFPKLLNIIFTNKCNLKCIMCNDNIGNFSFSDKELNDLIDTMPYLKKLTLRGGEVFIDKRIFNVLETAYKEYVQTEIVTNGLLLNENKIEKIVDYNISMNFSVDSTDKYIYESVRHGANFEKLIENIKIFDSIRKKKNANLRMRLTMVVMKRNYKDISKMIDFSHNYGFDEIYLLPVVGNIIPENERIFELKDKNIKILRELEMKREYFYEQANKYGIVLNNQLPVFDLNNNVEFDNKIGISCSYTDTKETKNKIFCSAPWEQMFIFNNNVCVPTCICPKNKIEEVKEKTDNNFILNLWNSNSLIEYRKRIVNNSYFHCCNDECINNKNRDDFKNSIKY